MHQEAVTSRPCEADQWLPPRGVEVTTGGSDSGNRPSCTPDSGTTVCPHRTWLEATPLSLGMEATLALCLFLNCSQITSKIKKTRLCGGPLHAGGSDCVLKMRQTAGGFPFKGLHVWVVATLWHTCGVVRPGSASPPARRLDRHAKRNPSQRHGLRREARNASRHQEEAGSHRAVAT